MTDSWRQRALAVMPVGSSTNSKAPALLPDEPEVIVRGRGGRVWDDRGREFIDFRCALGPVTLGYADPRVEAAIRAQLEDGILFGHPHPLETTTAELFCSLVPGKGVANGMPLSVYCGRREVLGVLDRGEVVVTSTYGGETLSLAAASATMAIMRDEGVPARLRELGGRLQDGLNALFERAGVAVRLEGHPTCPQFVGDPALIERFLRAAFACGVSFYRVAYVNAGHTDADIADALRRCALALEDAGR